MINGICPAYLPSIDYMAWLINQKKLYFVTSGNYQKQTFRNRAEIYGPNGKLKLIIPIIKNKNSTRQKDLETLVDNNFFWQRNHWRSLQISYRASPFFEFYEDDFYPFFNDETSHLMKFNIGLIKIILKLLKHEIPIIENCHDEVKEKRELIISKRRIYNPKVKYNQVFMNKHGFLNNLSIVDLLFNLGPESINYLKSIKV
ncbi:MAG: WbqC family protein [Bacteroidota bacterium]|nr:WbqC family protein [Bacteroidota bacterium]